MIPVTAKIPQNPADWAVLAAILIIVLAAVGLGALWNRARGRFRRPITELFKEPEPLIGDDAFNKRWQVVCDDRAFASGFLTPQIREFLLRAPSCKRWLLGEGWATCTWRKTCGEKDLAPL